MEYKFSAPIVLTVHIWRPGVINVSQELRDPSPVARVKRAHTSRRTNGRDKFLTVEASDD